MTVDFLDKALLYLKNNASFTEVKGVIPEFTEQENKLLVRALYKLEKDGYTYTNTTIIDRRHKRVTFYISFDGLLALENAPFIWKNRPYRWNVVKEKITAIWNVSKIVAIVVNALIVLLFTYLTYYKK